jgi:Kef-type K+ transport system membrane component KefB
MQQEPTFWDDFVEFIETCFDSTQSWVIEHPWEAASVGSFSIGIGVAIGLLSANPIGIIGGIFASIFGIFGGSYLGVRANNQAERAHRFEGELAESQARTAELVAMQNETNTQILSTQIALTNNLTTIGSLQQGNNNASEQRAATTAAVATATTTISDPESPVAQTAPVISIFQRSATRHRTQVNLEPEPIVNTQNP